VTFIVLFFLHTQPGARSVTFSPRADRLLIFFKKEIKKLTNTAMRLEVINTGTELLLGQTLNTHAAWLGQEMFPLGLRIARQVTLPDGDEIRTALLESFARGAEIIIITGGLGPTSDDLTRDIVAELLALPLEEDPTTLQRLRDYLASRKREINADSRRQAQVPRGATVLANDFGTAPGLYVPPQPQDGGQPTPHLFLLPGPPRELKPMFAQGVLPVLKKVIPHTPPAMRCFRLHGVGESHVARTLEPALLATGLSELGYCAKMGEVLVRCIGPQSALDGCHRLVAQAFPAEFFAEGDETMDALVIRLLMEKNHTLTLAESCTGGLVSHRLTNVPGSSSVIHGGFVTYANEAKIRDLGVPADLIAEHGAVSEAVARAMAEGALQRTGSTHALSLTGIAGPGGGSEAKPVGTVHLALASQGAATAHLRTHYPFERETVKFAASQEALNLLRRRLLGSL
jgi:nicotinamide-nucleotide amidase